MEKTQQDLMETQKRMLKAQEEKNIEDATKRKAEQTDQLTKVEELLETQLGNFRKEQDNKFTETRHELKQEFKNTLENKVETISLKVANQMAATLMDAFKEYISPAPSLVGGAKTHNTDMTWITQEGGTPIKNPQRPRLLSNKQQHEATTTGQKSAQSNSVITNIDMIDENLKNKRSSHDTIFSERTNDK